MVVDHILVRCESAQLIDNTPPIVYIYTKRVGREGELLAFPC